ncbi:MAG: rhodanese-like domain-containing protein [Pseudomonadales bacterium]|nr:rhodanese-like domain-containing protein [Pseudomonadales bacterium]
MEHFFTFLTNHALLSGTFLVLLALFIRNEVNRGGQGVSAQELVELVNKQNAVVVDLRDKKEFDQGHLVGAINIPYASLDSRVEELKKYHERPVVLVCRMGQHAGTAGTQLRKQGFTNISRLTGGFMEWRNQNLPVVKA